MKNDLSMLTKIMQLVNRHYEVQIWIKYLEKKDFPKVTQWYISNGEIDTWIMPIGGNLCYVYPMSSGNCKGCPLKKIRNKCIAIMNKLSHYEYTTLGLYNELKSYLVDIDYMLAEIMHAYTVNMEEYDV
jgi:hypothetical protein